ncbi:MAG TPA: hypothetical protein DDY13_15890 [Cytophagales bacterium]|jgi:hypothetical protein|nr:hypothetical protein [Cytophagales bacterium]
MILAWVSFIDIHIYNLQNEITPVIQQLNSNITNSGFGYQNHKIKAQIYILYILNLHRQKIH